MDSLGSIWAFIGEDMHYISRDESTQVKLDSILYGSVAIACRPQMGFFKLGGKFQAKC